MPLSPETLKGIRLAIREAEKKLKAIEPDIKQAQAAGIDVTARLMEARKLGEQIAKLKLVYGA